MIPARALLTEDSSDETAVLLASARPRLAGILRVFGVAAEDREDLLQDVFLAFVAKRAAIQSPEPWLRQALRLRCRQYCRDRAAHRRTPLDDAAECLSLGPGAARWAGQRVDVERELARLPARLRAVLLLRFFLGLDSHEVALRTGLAVGSIRKTVTRGLATLRRRLRACAPRRPAAGAVEMH